jgi:hypothetical protein
VLSWMVMATAVAISGLPEAIEFPSGSRLTESPPAIEHACLPSAVRSISMARLGLEALREVAHVNCLVDDSDRRFVGATSLSVMTVPRPAPRIGRRLPRQNDGDPPLLA